MRIEMLEAELEGAKDGHRQELEQATADLSQTQEVVAACVTLHHAPPAFSSWLLLKKI